VGACRVCGFAATFRDSAVDMGVRGSAGELG